MAGHVVTCFKTLSELSLNAACIVFTECTALHIHCIGSFIHTVGIKKSSHLPSVQRDGQYRAIPVPFPFNFRVVAVLFRFQTVPVLSQGQNGRAERKGGPF